MRNTTFTTYDTLIHFCQFVGLVAIPNCSMHGHGLFKMGYDRLHVLPNSLFTSPSSIDAMQRDSGDNIWEVTISVTVGVKST